MARFFEKVTEHKTCVLISLQLSSEIFLIIGRTERVVIIDVYWYSCKVPVIPVTLILKYQISLKSVQWELSCSMRKDG
jgi:hypothetical protein